jgi:hypothetical protein
MVNKIQIGIFEMSLDTYFILMLCQTKNKSGDTHKYYKTYVSIMEHTTTPIKGAQFNFSKPQRIFEHAFYTNITNNNSIK